MLRHRHDRTAGSGDSGALNELVAVWCHASLADCNAARASLAADPAWHDAEQAAAALTRHRSRQLVETTSFTPVAPPPAGTRLVDLRSYTFRPGALRDFLPVCESDGFPAQQRHCGALVFHGVALAPNPDQLVQAWAYADRGAYEAGQRALFRDPAWAHGYRERVIGLVDVQEHRCLKVVAPAAPQARRPPLVG